MRNHTRLLKCIINSGVRKLIFPTKINTMKFSLIIFLIVCCVCHQVDSAPPPPPPSYTVIQMVMLWPPTYCKTGNPCKEWSQIRKNFGLHGLWPADKYGDGVIDCSGPSIPTYSSPAALKAYVIIFVIFTFDIKHRRVDILYYF